MINYDMFYLCCISHKIVCSNFQLVAVKGILPPRVGGTRWLPHIMASLNALFRCYQAYVTHLENESHRTAKAEGLAIMAKNFNVICFAMILHVRKFPFLLFVSE